MQKCFARLGQYVKIQRKILIKDGAQVITFNCGLAQIWSEKQIMEKIKKYVFEALFKLKIHEIKTLHLAKSFPPKLSFGVKLGHCLLLHRHFLPGTAWEKFTLWCYTDPVWAASSSFGEHQVVHSVPLN